MQRILLAGATGLIGTTVLELALSDARFDRTIALTRKSLPEHPRLEQWIAQDDDLLSALRSEPFDAVICCLGTTIRNVGGDKSRFIHVDKDLVLGLGRWAKAQGVPVFCVVSAMGANASSAIFYNRVKGEMEEGLKALSLPALHIFQPSILTGPRREKRMGERIGIAVMKAVAWLLPARLKPMPHDVLAKALLNAASVRGGGTHQYSSILELAAQKFTTAPRATASSASSNRT